MTEPHGSPPRKGGRFGIVSMLPFFARLQLFERVINPLTLRRYRTMGAPPVQHFEIQDVWDDLPPVVIDAIERHGRSETNEAAGEALTRGYPVSYAIFSGRRSEKRVRIRDDDGLLAREPARPRILIVPHLGPAPAIPIHLAVSGVPVVGLTHGPARIQVHSRVAKIAMGSREVADGILLSAMNRGSGFATYRALKDGYTLVWQADHLPSSTMGDSGNLVPVDYLGVQIMTSSLLAMLRRRSKAQTYLGVSRMLPKNRVEITYTGLCSADDPAEDSEYMQLIFSAMSKAIVANIDQWRILRTPQLSGLPAVEERFRAM